MPTPESITRLLSNNFPFEASKGQLELMEKLGHFFSMNDPRSAFIIKGYAGTGKTAFIDSIVKTLPFIGFRSHLLAPIGRAAKVLSQYTGKHAFTIHKQIYRQKILNGMIKFSLQFNLFSDTYFIIDEASMIAGEKALEDEYFETGGTLLDDLLTYVMSGNNCRLIFVGDTAQLPPVGSNYSVALDEHALTLKHLNVSSYELNDVVRQKSKSGIVANATMIRNQISEMSYETGSVKIRCFNDVEYTSHEELEDILNSSYNKTGLEETIIICRSNRQAYKYNQYIRQRILWKEEEISAGDYIMIVRNNYYWLPAESSAGFMANGEICEITKVTRYHERYGSRFADVILRMVYYEGEPHLECRINLDSLTAESSAPNNDQIRLLAQSILEDYPEAKNKKEKAECLKKDPFYNALQIKFAYAITCHKAQGGQWKTVFVDRGYFQGKSSKEDLRWLYTAITRATEKLHIIESTNKDTLE